jgi:hypothetical protein
MGLGAGFGATVETGTAGGPVGVIYAATGATVYASVQASSAEINANAAYDAEWQSVIAYNQATLAHPRPLPLAGRQCKAEEGVCWHLYQADTAQCDEMYEEGTWAHNECILEAARNYSQCLHNNTDPDRVHPFEPLRFR